MKKRSSFLIAKTVFVVLLLSVIVTLSGCGMLDGKKYKEAVALFDNGQYDEAITAFTEIKEYEDSSDFIMYIKTLQLAESGEYGLASTTFEAMNDFKDSQYLSVYYSGRQAEKEQRYEDADALYRTIAIFSDCTARIKSLPDLILERDFAAASKGLDDNYFDETDKVAFSALASKAYSNSETRMLQDIYDLADKTLAKGEYEVAYELFDLLFEQEYSNSALRLQDCQFEYAKDLMNEDYEKAFTYIQDHLRDYEPANEIYASLPDLILKRDFDAAVERLYDGEYSYEDATVFASFAAKSYADSETRMLQDIYDHADTLLNLGEYEIAGELFLILNNQNFSDSAIRIQDCRFEHIKVLMNSSRYDEACSQIETFMVGYEAPDDTFKKSFYHHAENCYANNLYNAAYSYYKKAQDYSDAADKAIKFELDYQAAKELIAVGKYEEAHAAFTALRDYLDSAECASESLYLYADQLFDNGEYHKSQDVFTVLDGYKDSKERVIEAATAILDEQYDAANQLLIEQKYEEAITAFTALDGYRDSVSKITEARTAILDAKYEAANQLMINGKYEDAINAFSALDGYRDSAAQIDAAKIAILDMEYDAANQLLTDKKYPEAIAAFTALNGHRDSETKIDIATAEMLAARYVRIDSATYQANGITYVNGSIIDFSWGVEFDVESYTAILKHEDGALYPLETTTSNFMTINANSLQPGMYSLMVGAMPIAGSPADIFWNEILFAIPEEETVEMADSAPVIIPFGEAYTIQTEVDASGKARRSTSISEYETLDLTLQVTAHKDPAYYKEHYEDDYNLQGNEAAVEFEITLNDYHGAPSIIPQYVLLFSLRGKDENITTTGFQLTDAEISGNTDVVITNNTTSTLFKRYSYSDEQGDMVYLVVNSYVGGKEYTYWFELISPESNTPKENGEVKNALSVGSSGPEVMDLQEKLVKFGLLTGQPDGNFGNYTAAAVKVFQEWVNDLRGEETLEVSGRCDELTMAYLDYCIDNGFAYSPSSTLHTDKPDQEVSLSAPIISIASDVYRNNGITYVDDLNLIFNWYAVGNVQSYTINLIYEDGTSYSLGNTTETSKTVSVKQLQPGLYKLYVGAIPEGGNNEDALWSELTFGIPAPKPITTSEEVISETSSVETVKEDLISYIDSTSSAEDIQTVQMALYSLGLLNAVNVQPGVLDIETLQSVAIFQQKINEVFDAGLYVIDPVIDTYIDKATLEYLLYQ